MAATPWRCVACHASAPCWLCWCAPAVYHPPIHGCAPAPATGERKRHHASPVPTERTRTMHAMTDLPGQRLTRQLAAQARALTLVDLPTDIRTWARQCVLDYVACTL